MWSTMMMLTSMRCVEPPNQAVRDYMTLTYRRWEPTPAILDMERVGKMRMAKVAHKLNVHSSNEL